MRVPTRGLKVYLAGSRVLTAILGLVQLSALARILPTESYAVVAAAIAAAAYVQLTGEPAILGYERLGHHERASDFRPRGARSVASTVLLLIWFIVLLSAFVWGLLRRDTWMAMGVALWAVSLVQLRWVSTQYLNWGAQARYATTTLVNSAARTACVLFAAMAGGRPETILICGAMGSIVATALVSPSARPFSLDRVGLRTLVVVGLPLTAASAARTSLAAWPMLAGARQLDVDAFASFAAQWSLSTAVWGATIGFVLLFGFPQAKRLWDTRDLSGSYAVTARYLGYVSLAGPALMFLWLITGQLITARLLGAGYAGVVVPVWSTAVGCLASVANVVAWDVQLRYKQNALARATVAAALIQVPLVVLLTHLLGLGGVLISVATVQLGLNGAMLRLSHAPSRVRSMWLSAALWGVCAACALSVL